MIMSTTKTNNMITYKRGKVEIKGNNRSAWWLMFIDMIGSNIKWIIGAAATVVVEGRFEVIASFFKWVSGVP